VDVLQDGDSSHPDETGAAWPTAERIGKFRTMPRIVTSWWMWASSPIMAIVRHHNPVAYEGNLGDVGVRGHQC